MRILHVVGQLDLGGTEKTAILFCKYLKKMGHEVLLFSMSGGRRLEQASRICDIKRGDIKALDEAMFWFDPEIVHFHRGGWAEDELMSSAVFTVGAPKIVETNIFGDIDRGKFRGHLSASYFVSEYIKNWHIYAHQPGEDYNLTKLKVIHNPIEPVNQYRQFRDAGRKHLMKEFNIPPDHIVAGRIGRADNLQGISVDALQRIWDGESEIKPEAFHFAAVAPPEGMHESLCMYPNYHVIPFLIDPHELSCFYGGIDVLLHDRWDGETFGCGIAEAMMMRTCVISHVSDKYQAQFETMGADPEVIPQLAIMKPGNIVIREKIKRLPGGYIVGSGDAASYVEAIERAIYNDEYDPDAAQAQAMKFEAEEIVRKLEAEYLKL